ncbi:unnamed protein product [Brassica napus]|uniref:(rape) hypothetical protein n=1 Tax=Brassica napus TaxID=3708 RepID=A0A816IZV8_BRANA|nr:unnamed protein product [Brassica napus]
MASSAPAVFSPTSFDDLRLGRSAQFFVARLLRFWDSRNIKKQETSKGTCPYWTKLLLGESTNSVMVITSLNPQKRSIDSSLSDAVGEDVPSLNAETLITTKELSPTGDLSKFLSNSSSQLRLLRVSHKRAGTMSLALTAVKKLETQPHLTPATSVMIPMPPLLYNVELLVDDGENYATFLVLDKEMIKLTKQDAATLFDDENVVFTFDGKVAEVVKMEYGESSTSAAATYTSTNEADKDGPKYSIE